MRSWKSPDIYRPFPRNVLLYDGPSQLTGARILVIATAQNGNRKIGHMAQIWIIPSISPIAAVRSGLDSGVCGDCKMRGDGITTGRTCYVEWWRSVENIWQARAKAAPMSPREFAVRFPGLQLRIGAYGDPVAVPAHVWRNLMTTAGGWTAYTHQWKSDRAAAYRTWCMASVDTLEEQREAAAAGWRTFRVRQVDEELLGTEVSCPASAEGGHKAVCADCELCRGVDRRGAKHVAIVAHGRGSMYFGHARRRVIPLVEA